MTLNYMHKNIQSDIMEDGCISDYQMKWKYMDETERYLSTFAPKAIKVAMKDDIESIWKKLNFVSIPHLNEETIVAKVRGSVRESFNIVERTGYLAIWPYHPLTVFNENDGYKIHVLKVSYLLFQLYYNVLYISILL